MTAFKLQAETTSQQLPVGRAAPEMYAALKDCATIINAMHNHTLPSCFVPTLECVNAVNYAIAKAEGRAE